MTTWGSLEERPQAYLTTIFRLDQDKEREHNNYWSVHHVYDQRKASEWQQITYEELLVNSVNVRRFLR